MLIEDIMKTEVPTVELNATILTAVDKMVGADTDSVLVTRDRDVIGVLTGTGLSACVKEGHRPQDCPVFRHVSIEVRALRPRSSVSEAAQIMLVAGTNRLPVIQLGHLVGEVSVAAVLRATLDQASEKGEPISTAPVG